MIEYPLVLSNERETLMARTDGKVQRHSSLTLSAEAVHAIAGSTGCAYNHEPVPHAHKKMPVSRIFTNQTYYNYNMQKTGWWHISLNSCRQAVFSASVVNFAHRKAAISVLSFIH
jgi:hypothetical protein